MRKARWILAGALMASIASGCTDSTAPATPADPLLLAIAAAGFDTVGIWDLGEHFLVEGDISIAKSIARKWAGQRHTNSLLGPLFQWRFTNIVGQTKIFGIKVDLNGLNSQPAWQTAARAALSEWNNVGNSAVYFVEGTPGDIQTRVEFSHPGGCGAAAAKAEIPDGVNPGIFVTVYTCWDGLPNNSSTKLRTMVHELGHAIGFRHSNWWCFTLSGGQCVSEGGEIDPGAIQVPGTPALDSASVMNSGFATSSWTGFSTNDLVAARTLYPKVASVAFNYGNVIEDVMGPNAVNLNYGVIVTAYTASGTPIPGKSPQSLTI